MRREFQHFYKPHNNYLRITRRGLKLNANDKKKLAQLMNQLMNSKRPKGVSIRDYLTQLFIDALKSGNLGMQVEEQKVYARSAITIFIIDPKKGIRWGIYFTSSLNGDPKLTISKQQADGTWKLESSTDLPSVKDDSAQAETPSTGSVFTAIPTDGDSNGQ